MKGAKKTESLQFRQLETIDNFLNVIVAEC